MQKEGGREGEREGEEDGKVIRLIFMHLITGYGTDSSCQSLFATV